MNLTDEDIGEIRKLLCVLLHDVFCEAEEVPLAASHTTPHTVFFSWLESSFAELDDVEISAKAGTDEDTWFKLRELVHGGAVSQFGGAFWYAIALSRRPESPSPIDSINLICNITYKDKSISTTQTFVQAKGNADSMPDYIFFQTLHHIATDMLSRMMVLGSAELHTQAQGVKYTAVHDNDPFDVFMGWCIKFMLRGETIPAKLDPRLVPAMRNYLQLARQCIRPDPERLSSDEPKSGDNSKLSGGWNI